MEERNGGGVIDLFLAPFAFAGIVVLALIYWNNEFALSNDVLVNVFIAIAAFGFVSGFMIWAHFTVARTSGFLLMLLMGLYLLPVLAFVFPTSWTPLVNDERTRLAAVLISAMFAYFSAYSILFLGIERFVEPYGIDLNKSGLRYFFPGFAIAIDDDARGRSQLVIPATISLIFSLALAYYFIDLEFPYSLFEYRIASNQPVDVLRFVGDELCRAIPISDTCEIWDIHIGLLEARLDNVLFRVVRSATNVTFGIAMTLLFVYFRRAQAASRR